ncbi:MAG: hypothetical protein Q4P05_07515 [Actinomycetaceae bacterium]|nr:hypothetical protein [Actinomycetaceae bacterium]
MSIPTKCEFSRHLHDLADETTSFAVADSSDSSTLGFHELVNAYRLFRSRAESSKQSAHNWFHKTAVAVNDTTRHIKEKDEQWADEFAAVEIHLAPSAHSAP